jgi:hypothetical protein
MSWLASLVAGFFGSLFAWLEEMRRDKARVSAEKDAAVTAVDDETDDIIGEIADERSKVTQLDDAELIAERLRKRISSRGPGDRGDA